MGPASAARPTSPGPGRARPCSRQSADAMVMKRRSRPPVDVPGRTGRAPVADAIGDHGDAVEVQHAGNAARGGVQRRQLVEDRLARACDQAADDDLRPRANSSRRDGCRRGRRGSGGPGSVAETQVVGARTALPSRPYCPTLHWRSGGAEVQVALPGGVRRRPNAPGRA
jgi:hypothetical protein